jgi:hypothetical protein
VINGRQCEVIGIAPDGFYGPALGEVADLWLPLAKLAEIRSTDRQMLTDRGSSWLTVMGRLRKGATEAGAQAMLTTVAVRNARAYPESSANRGAIVSSAGSGLAPDGRGELLPLAALLFVVSGTVP